ncbi:hypothetical protein EV426DRAFT_639568 [Tirmania nivea]|nr:hypothetical protein EV426DRAFT_639568 [Tirmania nivea]
MVTRSRKNSSTAGTACLESTSGADIDNGQYSRFLTANEGISEVDTPLKDTLEFPDARSAIPLACVGSATGGSYLLLIITSIVLSPVHYVRHIYRHGSRFVTAGGRRFRRALEPVFGHISGDYQAIPISTALGEGNVTRGSTRPILIFCTLVFVFVIHQRCGGTFDAQPARYIQGQTYPVNTSDPEHHMLYHMGGMNTDLELTPYGQGEADIFRIKFTHANESPVPLYRYISTLKGGYEGKTSIYESVSLNNTKVVFKHFFTMTRSQPVPRDVRSKVLSEARALNRVITGESDWTSGMSVFAEEGNLWGWLWEGPSGKVSKYDMVWRNHRMEWPVEVAASMRQWAPFKEVIGRLLVEKGMNCTEIGGPKKIERWSIEDEQEEGELIRILDVFYLPDFEITKVDVEDTSKSKGLIGNPKRKRSQLKQQTGTDSAKESWVESVALREAAGLVEEMKTEELAERKQVNGNFDTTPAGQKKVKEILRNLSTDVESWGMVLPLLDGGDVDNLLGVLPLIGLSPADLDWLYRPLFAHGVLKALARMHHTKEDTHDRNAFLWRLIRGKRYSEKGTSEFTGNDNKHHAGTHGIPRARRPQRIDDSAEGYCHGDVKLDNIFIRRVAAEKKPTIETTISDADAATHQFRKPEDYLAVMKTEKEHPTLEPPRGPRHYLVLSDLSQTRPLHHTRHMRNNWRDCRLVDMDRAWRSYLQLLRMGSQTRRDRNSGESPTKRFDKVFLKWRSAFSDNNGLLPFQPKIVWDAKANLQPRTEPAEPEEYVSAYFTWLANPQIPSSFFLPQNITEAQSAHGIFASDFWTRELPLTRKISIMGSPAREMSRSQVFSVIDGMKGEIELIQEKMKSGRPVSIPSWYYEFGGKGQTRPGGRKQGEEEETEEERLVRMGTWVLGEKLMGM